MSTYTITTTDDQDAGLTFSNACAYPDNGTWLQAYLNPILTTWGVQAMTQSDARLLDAVKADPTLLQAVTAAVNKSQPQPPVKAIA